jgi:Domain of unknown function (DUF4131)
MKRPFVTVVSFYAIGLLLAGFFQPPLTALFTASFLILILFFALKKFRPSLLCALLVLSGWTNLNFHTAILSPNDLRRLIGGETEIVTLRGALAQMPQIKLSQRGGREKEHTLAQLHVAEIQGHGNWQPAVGEVIVYTPGTLPAVFFGGQSVEIKGVIDRPPAPLAD